MVLNKLTTCTVNTADTVLQTSGGLATQQLSKQEGFNKINHTVLEQPTVNSNTETTRLTGNSSLLNVSKRKTRGIYFEKLTMQP